MLRVGLLCLACFGVSLTGHGQEIGGLPALDWRRWEGAAVDVVSPLALAPLALRARTLDSALAALRPLPLGTRLKPIDVFVQPVTVVPNGFVGVTPWRSFLYATPPQDQRLVSTTDWVDALAIHEYRHVEQYANLLRGWTRAARTVFGNGGWGVATGLSTPDWFFEGDAVYAESALTYAGRARTPAFTALQRALAIERAPYRYFKARNGSLRSRVPDHYRLGLALVTHGRQVYGDPWAAVVRRAGNFWPPFYPFSVGLRRQTGLHTPAFYREAYDSLGQVWRAGVALRGATPAPRLSAKLLQLETYALPQPIVASPGELIALHRSQVDIPHFVRVDTAGRRAPLIPAGASVDDQFHLSGDRLVWTQYRLDPRRSDRSYSVIMRYDLGGGGGARQLTRASSWFAPALNRAATRIVAVRQTAHGATLHELDAETGAVVRDFGVRADQLLSPRYTRAGGIVVVSKRGGWLALTHVDTAGHLVGLTPWTRHVIGTPYVDGGHVYFSASFTGTDQIFRVGLAGGPIEQLTEVPVAAYGPSVAEGQLYFTEVTGAGDPISVLPEGAWLKRPTTIVEPVNLPDYAAYVPDGAGLAFRDAFYASSYAGAGAGEGSAPPVGIAAATPVTEASRPYRSLVHGLRVTTIQPLVNRTEASLTLDAQTLLGDYAADLGLRYNLNERRASVGGSFTVARTWPWVQVGVQQQGRSYVRLDRDSASLRALDFEQTTASLALVAPLDQVRGAYRLSLRPQVGLRYIALGERDAEALRQLPGERLAAVQLGFTARRLRFQAPKHILPREGQSVALNWLGAVDGTEAGQVTGSATQFLPGVVRSHGIVLRAAFRSEPLVNRYRFADNFGYARGYELLPNARATTLTAEYHLPLLNPDVGAAGVVYLLRVRAAVWADATTIGFGEGVTLDDDRLASVGLDLTGDFVFFNAQPLPVGVRVGYRLREDVFGRNAVGWIAPRVLVSLGF